MDNKHYQQFGSIFTLKTLILQQIYHLFNKILKIFSRRVLREHIPKQLL